MCAYPFKLEDILICYIQILINNHYKYKKNMISCPQFDQEISEQHFFFVDSIFREYNPKQTKFEQKDQEILSNYDQENSPILKEKKTQISMQNQGQNADLFGDLHYEKNQMFWSPRQEKQIQFEEHNLYTTEQSNHKSHHQQIQESFQESKGKVDPFKRMALRIKNNINGLLQKQKNNDNQKFAICKNMPRYFLKLMVKYFGEYGCKIQISKDLKDSLKNKSGINMKRFRQILKGENSLRKRQIMAKVLRGTLKKQVIQKPYITDKLSYMNSIKMFCLRCSSQQLIGRLKCK